MLDHFSKVTHMHTHTCVHTYTRTHAHMCTHTHKQTQPLICTISLKYILTTYSILFQYHYHEYRLNLLSLTADSWECVFHLHHKTVKNERWSLPSHAYELHTTDKVRCTTEKIYTCTQIYNICDLVNYLPEHILKVVWSIYAAKVDVLY